MRSATTSQASLGFWGTVPGQIIEPSDPASNYNKDFNLPNGIAKMHNILMQQ